MTAPATTIGLVPAAGWGSRVQPLPCSKEIYPVGGWYPAGADGPRPRVASHCLLEAMRRGGADRAFIILRDGKWDVPAYFRDGSLVSMHVAYLVARLPFGVPHTLDQAYPFVRDSLVLVGFPDLLFRPDHAFEELRRRYERTRADAVLGLFHAGRTAAVDMVDVDDSGRIRSVVIKPLETRLKLAWLIALWTPRFTEYLHEFAQRDEAHRAAEASHGRQLEEVSASHVVQAALADGLAIEGVEFPGGSYVDLGDPDELVRVLQSSEDGGGARPAEPVTSLSISAGRTS